MSLKWEILLAGIRLLFVIAPFMNLDRFELAGNALKTAKEFANVNNCRAMLVTLPVELFVKYWLKPTPLVQPARRAYLRS